VFENLEGISGGAIMGDGKVGLILDAEKMSKII
jgi:chemotaxis protein histidine kinase CheA